MQFELVRKGMKMKTEGPTLNEISDLDTTGNVEQETTYREPTRRPVSIKKKVKNWIGDNTRNIIIGIVYTIIALFVADLIINHGIHLAKHDKDIEVLQKNDDRHENSIEKLQDKTNDMKTDLRLIEQRVQIESEMQHQQQSSRKKDK